MMKLIELLSASTATPAFRESLEDFIATATPSGRIDFPYHAPPIKVARTLTKALELYPDLEIEAVAIQARSGCEFFRGTLVLRTAEDELRVRFDWDCRWKAMQLGWMDYFGYPDQIRAAREFDHDCFRVWEEERAGELSGV
jgi:hypothetical protein